MGAGVIRRDVERQLRRIDPTRPRVDRDAVADRLGEYLEHLGLERRPLRWVTDPRELRRERVWPHPQRGRWRLLSARQGHLFSDPSRVWRAQRTPLPHGGRLAELDAVVLNATLGRSREVRAVHRVTLRLTETVELFQDDDPPKGRADALVPLAEAAAEGLLCFSVGDDGELVCVQRPTGRLDERRRLHDWDGNPAVSWPDGTELWYWRGVRMPPSVGRDPDRVTPRRALGLANAEQRRVAIERIGVETLLQGVGAEVVQQDDYGRLWRTTTPIDGEAYVAVEVVNATAEPDGTYRRYFLRVPPNTRTARRAVAWTFGVNARDYQPVAAT